MNWLTHSATHLIVLPILLPLFTAAVLTAVREKYRKTRNAINIAACFVNLLIVGALILSIKSPASLAPTFAIYLTANWDVPFGIPLLADRFSALMLLVAGVIALAAALFSSARWDRVGTHFHTLFQVQLMGINGAFLTADLFNLFVFFEILLTASYGLLLHGSGPKRVQAGLHYIAINLVASFLFLIGIALIYNTTGTLNFADIALYTRNMATAGNGMLYMGFAILGVAFLAKAAMWPINFWLVPAYSIASPPAAALFALLTKVGMYILLRLSCLFFSTDDASQSWFGSTWLVYGGLLTLFFGALGLLSSTRPAKIAAYATLVSAGTLMSIVGFGQVSLTTAALYYLPTSTLAIAAFFLIAELIERDLTPRLVDPRSGETEEDRLVLRSYIQSQKTKREEILKEERLKAELLRRQEERARLKEIEALKAEGKEITPELRESLLREEITVNLDAREEEIVGRQLPAAVAFLGLSFACCALLIAGLPPLGSFIAKFGMLDALLTTQATTIVSTAAAGLEGAGLEMTGLENSIFTPVSPMRWVAVALIILSGFFALISFSRAGITYFWSPVVRPSPRLRVVECLPIILLIGACILLTVRAEVSLRYTRATSIALYTPSHYIGALMAAQPKPSPKNEARLSTPRPTKTFQVSDPAKDQLVNQAHEQNNNPLQISTEITPIETHKP